MRKRRKEKEAAVQSSFIARRCGKTTLARVLAGTTSADFHQVNTTVAVKKELEEVAAKAKENCGGCGFGNQTFPIA